MFKSFCGVAAQREL